MAYSALAGLFSISHLHVKHPRTCCPRRRSAACLTTLQRACSESRCFLPSAPLFFLMVSATAHASASFTSVCSCSAGCALASSHLLLCLFAFFFQTGFLSLSLAVLELIEVVHIYNPSKCEAEAGESKIQG